MASVNGGVVRLRRDYIGLDVGVGWLEGEVLNEFRILAVGVVNAEPCAHHCILCRSHGNADAGRKMIVLWVDQVPRVFAGEHSYSSGENGLDGGEIVTCVEGRETIVFLRVRGEVFVAQTEEQGQAGQCPPAILHIGIPGVLAQIRLLVRSLQRGLLRQTEQQVGQ